MSGAVKFVLVIGLIILGVALFNPNNLESPVHNLNLPPEKLTEVELKDLCDQSAENVRKCPNGDMLVNRPDNTRAFYTPSAYLVYTQKMTDESWVDVETLRRKSILYLYRQIYHQETGCNYDESKTACE